MWPEADAARLVDLAGCCGLRRLVASQRRTVRRCQRGRRRRRSVRTKSHQPCGPDLNLAKSLCQMVCERPIFGGFVARATAATRKRPKWLMVSRPSGGRYGSIRGWNVACRQPGSDRRHRVDHRLDNPAWHCLDRDFLRCRRDCSRHEAPRGAAVEASGVNAG